jgi:hypothetical protein
MSRIVRILGIIGAVLLLWGCQKKQLEPVPVGEMNNYRDPVYGFQMQYPKQWKQLGNAGKAVFVKSQDVLDKFLDPRSGEEGAAVIVEVIRYETKKAGDSLHAADFDKNVQSTKDELKGMNADMTAEGKGLAPYAGGKQSLVLPYRIQATTKMSIFGHYYFIAGDTAMYRLNFEGYGDQYTAHMQLFDAMLKAFQLPVVVAKKNETWQASATLEALTSNYFTIQYPDNMENVQVSKGSFDYSIEKRADRRDCSFHIDVFEAKKLTVDKVWDQNKARYRGAKGNGTTTIDGEKSFYVDYSPIKDVNSRAYFVVKNDKVVRTTLNWFAAQKDIYFPVLEGVVKSMKLK